MSKRPAAPSRTAALLNATVVAAALGLAGCASRGPAPASAPSSPQRPAAPDRGHDRDGAEAVVPPDLAKVPDAEPRLENIRKGGPNKPYEVLGQRYEPLTDDKPLVERGLASWYGKKFHGRSTASGEIYNMYAMTAAHVTMPIPSYARVRNPANGREVIVRINDRGPFHKGRIIDLSYTAALKLDVLRGVAPVEIERITYEDIRAGLWRKDLRDPPPEGTLLASARPADAATPDQPLFVATDAVGAPPRETTAQIATPVATVEPASAAVEAKPLPGPASATLPRHSAPGFWVQLGAFSKLDGAEEFRSQLARELDWMGPLLAIFRDAKLHRLQAGPYPSRDEARQAAERVREALALQAVVVERK